MDKYIDDVEKKNLSELAEKVVDAAMTALSTITYLGGSIAQLGNEIDDADLERLGEALQKASQYASSILQTINNAISKVSYLQGPFLQDNPRIERIDVKSLQATLRLSLALPVIEQQQMWLSFIFDPQSESIEKLCDSLENACCSYLPHGKQHIDEIRSWRLQFRNSLDDSVAFLSFHYA